MGVNRRHDPTPSDADAKQVGSRHPLLPEVGVIGVHGGQVATDHVGVPQVARGSRDLLRTEPDVGAFALKVHQDARRFMADEVRGVLDAQCKI